MLHTSEEEIKKRDQEVEENGILLNNMPKKTSTAIPSETLDKQHQQLYDYKENLLGHIKQCSRRLFLSTRDDLASKYAMTVLTSQFVPLVEHLDFLLSYVTSAAASVSGAQTEENLTDLAYCLSNYTKALEKFFELDSEVNTSSFSRHIDKLKPTLITLKTYYSWHFSNDLGKINSLLKAHYPSAAFEDSAFSYAAAIESFRSWSGISRLNLPPEPKKPPTNSFT